MPKSTCFYVLSIVVCSQYIVLIFVNIAVIATTTTIIVIIVVVIINSRRLPFRRHRTVATTDFPEILSSMP